MTSLTTPSLMTEISELEQSLAQELQLDKQLSSGLTVAETIDAYVLHVAKAVFQLAKETDDRGEPVVTDFVELPIFTELSFDRLSKITDAN